MAEQEDHNVWRATRLRAALVGAAAVVVLGVLGAAAVFEFGLFNVAASTAHLPEIGWFVHHTMIHSVRQRSRSIHVPASIPAASVAAGFCIYHAHCQMCHGGPTVARDKWANGINPPPPYLIDAPARWNSRELYWIVSNGVKMTAMPSWNASMSKSEIWSVVAFLQQARKMPPGTYARWSRARSCPTASDVVSALNGPPKPSGLPAALPK